MTNDLEQEGDIMILENTRKNREIKNVVATMAIEDMYFSEDFLNEIVKISKGEKTFEELRQEVIKKYARF
nr:antitoxin VbhA family protein [uncultured Shuttleworthia sp.]